MTSVVSSLSSLKEKIQNKEAVTGVRMILFHPNPHFEELGAGVILQKYGEKFFPGISKAEIGFVTQNQLNGFDPENCFFELLEKGYLLVGTGDGPFDEHNKKYATSCIKLVANYLGVFKNPELKYLIEYADYEDSHGDTPELLLGDPRDFRRAAAHQFMFATQIKNTWTTLRENEKERNQMLGLFWKMIELQIEHQIDFQKAKNLIKGKIEEIDLPFYTKAPEAKLVIVRSNHPQAVKASRVFTLNKNVVGTILISSTGNFQFFSSKKYEVRGEDIARTLRTYEFRAKRMEVPSWTVLGQEKVEGSDIHFHKNANNVYNGSLTQTDVPALITPKLLTEKDVINAIMLGAQNEMFDKKFHEGCKSNICAKGQCPLYKSGLQRCFDVRFNNPKKSE